MSEAEIFPNKSTTEKNHKSENGAKSIAKNLKVIETYTIKKLS